VSLADVSHSLREPSEKTVIGRVARGSSARTAASIMSFGNLFAIIFIPVIIFWWGASMLVYTMNRHHPNPKVGHYTQQAATVFYGASGFFIVVATLVPADDWSYYLVAWVLAALVIIPWSILILIRIYRDQWNDILLDDTMGEP